MKYDVIIIGSGLGGLECGYILSKKGLSVCVLEQNAVLGGCLQTFKRKGTSFDTGFHYIGGLGEGESLHRLFDYFNLMNLPWQQLDKDGFDEVILQGEKYEFASGRGNFVERMSQKFPDQRKNLQNFIDTLQNIGNNIFKSLDPKEASDFYQTPAFTNSAYNFLSETISNEKLRNVLSGTSLKLELNPEKLPLYIYAQINDSFIQSAWRIKGGGQQIAESLAKSIQENGGIVRTKAKVTELIENDGVLTAAVVNGEERIEAKHFISNLHPVGTLDLVKESKLIRKIYRRRISDIPNTYGMFTVNLQLKAGSVPYLNKNQYVYETDNLWSYHKYNAERKTDCLLISYQIPENGEFTPNIDLLTPMHWEEVQKWENSQLWKRGDEYESFKQKKAEECIALASKYVDGLENNIENIYTSTPLTYRDYTGTYHGSAYGIQKDHAQLMYTMLTPRTPIPNLILTGQNLNLHGILGVSMTSLFSSAEIIGMDTIKNEIRI